MRTKRPHMTDLHRLQIKSWRWQESERLDVLG